MVKPDFVMIGAMKCATSTVSAYLEDHPDVFVSPGAEPNFFSDDANWAKGPDWYAEFFRDRADERLCGENSNDYASCLEHPLAAERMHAYCPDAKIILMVRHPVARIMSAWVQNRIDHGDAVPPTLERAIAEMPDRFVGQSLYWQALSSYRAHFPDDRIFIGFMEDMQADQPAFMARLCDFLGVPPAPEIKRGHVNPSQGKRLPGKGYSTLRRVPGAKALARLLPRDIKRRIKDRLLSRKLDDKPRMSPQVRADLEALLREDSAALLRHCGKPADFWTPGGPAAR